MRRAPEKSCTPLLYDLGQKKIRKSISWSVFAVFRKQLDFFSVNCVLHGHKVSLSFDRFVPFCYSLYMLPVQWKPKEHLGFLDFYPVTFPSCKLCRFTNGIIMRKKYFNVYDL